ncbi:MAG: peptide chain release factor N(5)-glutamine methyltransferase [Ferruginibacter sp.]|nr:peptide chain release factor N(5)-glutamine methyltransferase [Ferruginibacter sp.]
MFALMTIKEIYRGYLEKLQLIYSKNEAAVITDWVFESIAGLQRADIIKNPGQIVVPSGLMQLDNCIEALLQHKPVQYVLGEAWFYKMKLMVNEQVLIPRPETEELVQLLLNDLQKGTGNQQSAKSNAGLLTGTKITNASGPLLALDIGTGSGCIAIAIKKHLPDTIMYAIDISTEALSVAKENAISQQVDIRFLEIDFLDDAGWQHLPVFDVIISNPPYIPLNEKEKLDKNVADFEPPTALFVPDNTPLLFYEKIADFGKKHLKCYGKIYVEIHEDFAKETMQVFEQFYTVEIKKDIPGKERMLIAVASTFQDLEC